MTNLKNLGLAFQDVAPLILFITLQYQEQNSTVMLKSKIFPDYLIELFSFTGTDVSNG